MANRGSDVLQPPPFLSIETDRLYLRTLQVSDAEKLLPAISKKEIMQWTTHRPITSLAEAERWVSDRCLGPDVFNFGIEVRSSGEFIGAIGSFHWPSVGYIIDSDHAGKGYATEALRALIPALFDRIPSAGEGGTGFDYIEARTDSENKGSKRVLEKSGFIYCETLLQDFENPMLGRRDTTVYRMPRPGRTLQQLGFLPLVDTEEQTGEQDQSLIPPIQ